MCKSCALVFGLLALVTLDTIVVAGQQDAGVSPTTPTATAASGGNELLYSAPPAIDPTVPIDFLSGSGFDSDSDHHRGSMMGGSSLHSDAGGGDHDHDHVAGGNSTDPHDEAEAEAEEEAQTQSLKGMAIAVIGSIGVTVDFFVIQFPQLRTKKTLMSLVASFGAGIFFVVGMSHLLGESTDIMATYHTHEIVVRYRPSYMVCIAGYFLMLVLQRGLFSVDPKQKRELFDDDDDDDDEDRDGRDGAGVHCQGKNSSSTGLVGMSPLTTTTSIPPSETSQSQQAVIIPSGNNNEARRGAGSNSGCVEMEREPVMSPSSTTVLVAPPQPHEQDEKNIHHHPPLDGVGNHVAAAGEEGKGIALTEAAVQEQTNDTDPEFQRAAKLNIVVFFVAFFVHGLTEGIALGLQRNPSSVIVVFVAIVSHHWAADFLFSFATGNVAELKRAPCLRFLLAAALSLNTSIGIGIGWAFQRTLPAIATGYILAFCAGTFLMIALTEVVADEMPLGKRNVPQLLMMMVGMGLMYMALALLYTPNAHNH